MKYPRCRLIQFARYPQWGRVKTRLSPALSNDHILQVHQWLVTKTLASLQKAALCPVDVWAAGSGQDPAGFWAALGLNSVFEQQGDTLGARMCNAFDQSLWPRGGAEAVVLVGSDCPFITTEIIDEAFQALLGDGTDKGSGADVVLGPADDGGYYLIGLKHSYSSLFEHMPWGSAEVFAITCERVALLGYKLHQLPTLPDIDRPEDLALLKHFSPSSLDNIIYI